MILAGSRPEHYFLPGPPSPTVYFSRILLSLGRVSVLLLSLKCLCQFQFRGLAWLLQLAPARFAVHCLPAKRSGAQCLDCVLLMWRWESQPGQRWRASGDRSATCHLQPGAPLGLLSGTHAWRFCYLGRKCVWVKLPMSLCHWVAEPETGTPYQWWLQQTGISCLSKQPAFCSLCLQGIPGSQDWN